MIIKKVISNVKYFNDLSDSKNFVIKFYIFCILEQNELEYKFLILGDNQVGKTSFIKQYISSIIS